MSAPPPPKLPSKPGKIRVYRALYTYEAQQPDELSFEEGDILYVQDEHQREGWWRGTCKGKAGLIPSNYIEENSEAIEFPLHEAAKRGNAEFFNQCLTNRVSINGLDKAGATPLFWAAHAGHIDLVEKLLSLPNLDLNAQNKMGDTALHGAAWKGRSNVVARLLEAGARPDLKNRDGKLAMEVAQNADSAALLKRSSDAFVAPDDDYLGSDDDD